MYRRVMVTRYGGSEVIDVMKEPFRTLQKGEVRVKVQYAGVALADIMRREGVYPSSPIPPFTPGYDVVGIVEEVGEDVKQYSIGDKVAALFNGTGGYAEQVYASEEDLVHVPDQVDSADAVAVILNYVTAYQMLHRIAKVKQGEQILIHGASGGVGTALLELGKLASLVMYGTASSSKHSILSKYGASAIDYRNEDFVNVLKLNAPEGMDAVFDPIGGLNWDRSLQTLSKTGRFVCYGYTLSLQQGDQSEWLSKWTNFASKKFSNEGNSISLYSITKLKKERLDWFREDVRYLFSLLEDKKISPLISHRIPLVEAAKAQELLGKSETIGKVILFA